MTIISEIKEHIAKNKLSDEKVRETWLKAASSDADNEEQSEQSDEESDVEEDSHEEESDADETAAETKEQTKAQDLDKKIAAAVAVEMAKLRRGKKPPKTTKKPNVPAPKRAYNYNQEFGEL